MNRKVRKKRPIQVRILGVGLRVLRWLGINVDLLVLEREGMAPVDFTPPDSGLTFGYLELQDIDELVRLDSTNSRDTVDEMFRDGKLCFGVWDDTRLIAKMWCDPDELYHPIEPRQLDADEVYLQLAYVDPEYRGQNIAPLMRMAGYEALQEIGITRFYSYSMYMNTQARRFKKKLGARSESLTVYIRWFGRWTYCRTFGIDN